MRILGIDPGLAALGYGIVQLNGEKKFECVTHGVISTPKEMAIGERLFHIERQLKNLIKFYAPDAAAVETLFFFRNQKTIGQVGEVHGIISLVLHKTKVPAYRYPPLRVKNVITGNGRAEKKELEKTMKRMLGMRKKIASDDTADALAVALCHLLTKK